MKVPVLNQSCCGCSLETGSTIIGWIVLVCGILGSIGAIVGLVSGVGAVVHIFKLIFELIAIGLGAALLTGIKGRLQNRLQLFIVGSVVLTTLFVVLFIIDGIILLSNGAISLGVGSLFGALIGGAIYAYCIIVVHNYKREMGPADNQNI